MTGNDLFFVSMIINGSGPEIMDPMRALVRERISELYPDREAACAALRADYGTR